MRTEIRSSNVAKIIEKDSPMDIVVKVSKSVMWIALALMFAGGFLVEMQTRKDEAHTAQHVNAILDHADAVVDQATGVIADGRTIAGMMEDDVYGTTRHINSLLDQANTQLTSIAPLLASAKVSTDNLQEPTRKLNQVVYDARLTIDNMNSAALDERFYFEHQIPELFNGITSTVNSVNARVNEFQPILSNAKIMTDGGASIATDSAFYVHRFVHPPKQPWYKQTWNATNDTGKLVWDFMR